ncbi:MAG: OmpA family protein [Saprospiraceae bacterium]|nr:OmpA family protein [Saprospiraceae bacterium]
MYKTLLSGLLLLCSLFSSVLQAQIPVKASVFFETDRSELTAEAQKVLDELAPVLLQAADYQVELEAFTDDRGTHTYNRQLAADRAASVQAYLEQKGLTTQKSSITNWGEKKARNTTDSGRRQDRRVDVLVHTYRLDDLTALRERLSANTDQIFPVQLHQELTITAAKGTMVLVPANAFVFEDGTEPTGLVQMTIHEAYDPLDFIAHHLTTTSGGQILQTGGMVSITAQSEGKPLRLADGMALTVAMPDGGNFDPQMELFYAQSAADGGVDWKPAGQKFRRTLKPARAELVIDPELSRRLAAIKVPEYPRPALPVFKGQMPPEPQMPRVPYKPRAPQKPQWESVQKMFAGGAEASRLSKKKLKKAEAYYQEAQLRYVRDSAKYVQLLERYHQNIAGYEKAKIRYAEEHKRWENELATRVAAILEYLKELKIHFYSKSLAKAIKIRAKTIRDYGTYSDLYWQVEELATHHTQKMMLGEGLEGTMTLSSYGENNLFGSIIGTKVIDHYKGYHKICSSALRDMLTTDSSNWVMRSIFASTGIRAISDSLQTELKERNLMNAQDPATQRAILNSYVATVSQLGWINCDRFYSNPAEKMQVVVPEAEETTMYAVCSDINAMLPFHRSGDGYVASGLPKGQKITVVAIKVEDGMARFAKKDMRVGERAPSLAFQTMPLKELKAELKKLNI